MRLRGRKATWLDIWEGTKLKITLLKAAAKLASAERAWALFPFAGQIDAMVERWRRDNPAKGLCSSTRHSPRGKGGCASLEFDV